MKKIIPVILAVLLLLPCLAVFAPAAGELPFELVAPAYLTAYWMEGGDSPTSTKLTYSLSNEITTFFKNKENAHLNDTIDQFMNGRRRYRASVDGRHQ